MSKRALIAEPDQEEANRQAAILTDDGYEAQIFCEGDVVAEVEHNPPDILVLRHERPGAQTGLAMVSRLKQVGPGEAMTFTRQGVSSFRFWELKPSNAFAKLSENERKSWMLSVRSLSVITSNGKRSFVPTSLASTKRRRTRSESWNANSRRRLLTN